MNGSSGSPAGKVRSWLQDRAWPFWSAHAWDQAHGGFVERFSLAGAPLDPGFKRCRVIARQTYVFSHAQAQGFAGAQAIAGAGYRYLVEKFHLGGGRWARRISTQGAVIDATQDLYDIAFALFALAWRARVSGDSEPVALARMTLEAVHAGMRHPTGEGYLHVEGASAPFEQNPHMHLLEAVLILAQDTQDSFFLEEADSLFRLAQNRFIAGTGTLAEFFEPGWRRPPKGRIEPGHHFEWTWLLKRYHDIGGSKEALDLAGKLFDFAIAHGVDPKSGLAWDALDETGRVIEADHRIWCQLEAIKAWIAIAEMRGVDASPAIARLVDGVLTHYLDPAHPGLWIDHVTRDLEPRAEFAPTSTLYHVFLGFSELLRSEKGDDA